MSSFDQKMSSLVNATLPRAAVQPPKHRANEIFQHTIGHYNFLKTQLKPEQSINLVCYIGGMVFDVYRVSATDHYFEITARDENESLHIVTSPVEQIAFDIIISKKTNDEPPREIGFKIDQSLKLGDKAAS